MVSHPRRSTRDSRDMKKKTIRTRTANTANATNIFIRLIAPNRQWTAGLEKDAHGFPVEAATAQLLAGVKGFHLGGNILVARVHFVNLFELFDGFVFLAHAFEHAAKVVDQVLFLLVENGLFLDRVL